MKRDLFELPGIDRRIILKLILKKLNEDMDWVDMA